MKRALVVLLTIAAAASNARAQVVPAGNPIVYGHHHVAASDIEVQKKFPGVLVFFRAQKPTGGTIGTTVNHIGFGVPDLRTTVNTVKAAGYTMITRTSVADNVEVKDDIATTGGGGQIAFVLGPDDVKVELVQVKGQTQPIALHHVHFFGQQNAEMRAWYEKTFNGKPRQGGGFLVADLPGVALNFTQSPEPTVGTSGRAMDHIGFEVKGLEAFLKNLEAQGVKITTPYRSVPALNLSIAFINDPWGTSIELTEGLDKVQ
jgi:catechol 2,3-dioxygenase-like lactoylglutathione lyase family enzyme